MSTATLDRLKWVAAQLQVLVDNEWVRYEGRQKFMEAKAELDDVVNTFVDNSALPVPVTLQAMTPDQVDQVAARMAATSSGIVTEVAAQIEQSDLAVLGAIAQSQSEVITALTPAPAA